MKNLAKEMIGVDFEKITLDTDQMAAIINVCRSIIAAKSECPEDEEVFWEDLGILLQGYFDQSQEPSQASRDVEYRQKWQDIYDNDLQDLH